MRKLDSSASAWTDTPADQALRLSAGTAENSIRQADRTVVLTSERDKKKVHSGTSPLLLIISFNFPGMMTLTLHKTLKRCYKKDDESVGAGAL